MISAGDFRKGVTVEIDGSVFVIVEFLHVKPGKGAAFVRTKLKNVITGGVVERTFNPNDKVERAHIETREMQYLYAESDLYYFMDMESYEQLPLSKDQVEDALPYLIDNLEVKIRFFKGAAFSVEPPNFLALKVVECEPGVRGDTATNITKQAKLETGFTLQVPIFINEGDTIRIDTRTGDYMERV
ncbi:MAG: elongation factor P [Clostridia bacterium]|nr:elongation factor P [Clostridia bacterium]